MWRCFGYINTSIVTKNYQIPCRFLANRRDRFAIDTTRRTNMATNPQQNLYSQLEHLQSKYVGTGHPDISRQYVYTSMCHVFFFDYSFPSDWCTNMARDSIATYLVRHIFSIAHIYIYIYISTNTEDSKILTLEFLGTRFVGRFICQRRRRVEG